jgi:hypothetical protein
MAPTPKKKEKEVRMALIRPMAVRPRRTLHGPMGMKTQKAIHSAQGKRA